MLEKYSDIFEEIHRKINCERMNPLEVAEEYSQMFKKEGIDVNPLFVIRYLAKNVNEGYDFQYRCKER